MGRRWVRQAAAGVRSLQGEAAPQAQTPVERRAQRHGWPGRPMQRRLVQAALVQAALVWPLCAASWAQSTPPAPVPIPDTPGLEISDRVKRDAERPMYWIRRLGEQTAGQDKANQERSATERQNAADKAANEKAEKAAERLAAERAARASRAEKTEKQAVSAPRPPLSEPTPTPALATRDGVAPRPDSGASGTGATPAPAASAPALAEAPPAAPGGSALEVPIASASSPATAADPPPLQSTANTDVAMATPPQHAEPAPPPSPPVADALVLRPGESLALPDSLMRRMRRGSVEVKVQVAPDGSVMDATIVQSSHPRLDSAALEAIKAAHFQPVSRPTTAVIQFGFDLDS